jgi:tuberculosinol/isotuberculosinol synthase
MQYTDFQQIETEAVAGLLRREGPKVCAFPLNGTRRWFLMEHPEVGDSFHATYFAAMTARLFELCALFYTHGVDTLISPLLNGRLFTARGAAYTRETLHGLLHLTTQPAARRFYAAHDVQVRFFGDYDAVLREHGLAEVADGMAQVMAETAVHRRHRLLWGICAENNPETIADLAVDFFTRRGRRPSRDELVTQYYGQHVPPVDIFISSGKPRVFDIPLLSTDTTDLYFTTAPSPYLNEQQLRAILFDHLYARPKKSHDYREFMAEDWTGLQQFYAHRRDVVLGVGTRANSWGVWHPLTTEIHHEWEIL